MRYLIIQVVAADSIESGILGTICRGEKFFASEKYAARLAVEFGPIIAVVGEGMSDKEFVAKLEGTKQPIIAREETQSAPTTNTNKSMQGQGSKKRRW